MKKWLFPVVVICALIAFSPHTSAATPPNGAAQYKVIDIYHGDGIINFTRYKAEGYDGVYIKATGRRHS